jgi:hypothetical protein
MPIRQGLASSRPRVCVAMTKPRSRHIDARSAAPCRKAPRLRRAACAALGLDCSMRPINVADHAMNGSVCKSGQARTSFVEKLTSISRKWTPARKIKIFRRRTSIHSRGFDDDALAILSSRFESSAHIAKCHAFEPGLYVTTLSIADRSGSVSLWKCLEA